MPIYIYHYHCELNESSQIIGVVECKQSKEFESKLDDLCKAMGWHRESVKVTHSYLGSVIDRFPHA